MVNLLHARVVFELLNIEHANCRIVALSQIASSRHVLKISAAYRVTSAA